jgi:glycerophosphoryl diester phosphodiesterase
VTLAIAHRGDPIAERENTLPAFDAALRQGADMIELDLRRTSDGAIVVIHDATLARLWGVPRNVADLDLSTLQGIGGGVERIPTFSEVLAHVGAPIMVDFTGREVVEGALEVAHNAGAMTRCLFVSGNIGAVRTLRALAPDARIGLTWVKRTPPPRALLEELGAEFWNPTFGLITPENVASVHRLGFKVSTWTVDKPRQMRRVMHCGVDAIVSNRIGRLRRRLS